jgi:hypothetical protein
VRGRCRIQKKISDQDPNDDAAGRDRGDVLIGKTLVDFGEGWGRILICVVVGKRFWKFPEKAEDLGDLLSDELESSIYRYSDIFRTTPSVESVDGNRDKIQIW